MPASRTVTLVFPGPASAATAAASVTSDRRWRGKITVLTRRSNIVHVAGRTSDLTAYLDSLRQRGSIHDRMLARATEDLTRA